MSDSSTADVLAPVDFIVVEFPDGVPTASGFEQLLDLVDRNVIRVLDLEFIREDGTGVRTVAVSDLAEHPGVDLAAWEGASSGLLDLDDLATIGAEIGDDSVAVRGGVRKTSGYWHRRWLVPIRAPVWSLTVRCRRPTC